MENQELFDKYIKGLLSETEKSDFESRLNTDKTLSSEFKTYLFVVKGIQKEEQQDCADFGAAMKKLSKEQLQEIIGAKAKTKARRNILKFSPWLWSSLSAAAVVAIVVTISFNLINQSQLEMNNAQYLAYNIIAEHNFDDGGFRGLLPVCLVPPMAPLAAGAVAENEHFPLVR
jgi:anti-sigma-K factor RskA